MPDISQSTVTTTRVTLNPSLDAIESLVYSYILNKLGLLTDLEVTVNIGVSRVTVDINHRYEAGDSNSERWTSRHDAIVEGLFPD